MVAVVLAALLVVVACSTPAKEHGAPEATTVGPDGFTVQVEDVTVSAGPGVAPEGTPVTVTPAAPMPASAVPDFVEQVGDGVVLVLGDGLQPQTPVEFRVVVDGGPPVGEGEVALLAVSADGSTDVLEARADAESGELVATTDHLSWLGFFRLGEKFTRTVLTLTGQALDVTYPDPECETRVEVPGVAAYEVFPPGQAYMCLSLNDAGEVELEVHSAVNMPYTVRTEPRVDAVNSPGSAAGLLSTAVMFRVPNDGVIPGVLAGGSTVRFTYPPGDAPEAVTLLLRPELLFVDLITSSLDRLHGGLSELVGSTQCWADMASTSLSANRVQSTSTATSAISTALGCAGSAIKGAGSVVLGLVLPLLQTLISTVLTNVEAIAKRDVITVAIDRTDLAPPPVTASRVLGSFEAMDGQVFCQSSLKPTEHPDGTVQPTEFLECTLGGYEQVSPDDPDCDGPLTVSQFESYLSYACGDALDRTGAAQLDSDELEVGSYTCSAEIVVVCDSGAYAVEMHYNDFQLYVTRSDGGFDISTLADIPPMG